MIIEIIALIGMSLVWFALGYIIGRVAEINKDKE